MSNPRRLAGVAALALGLMTACESSTDVETKYGAALSGSGVVPPVQTGGAGGLTAFIGPNNVLRYTIVFSGLSSASTAAHVHGPATATDTAQIVIDLNATASGRTIVLGALAGNGEGTYDFSLATPRPTSGISRDSLGKLLERGRLYVDVHSVSHPAGEIRGQIVRGRN